MLANIIIMALIIGYCAYLIYDMVKKIKTGGIRGCAGGCAGCSGCGGGCCSSDPDEVKKMIEKCTVSKGADQDGKFKQALCSICLRS